MKKKLIIAGGGTGGHIFPAIAIAHAIKKMDPQIEILFVGARGKMEMEKVPQAGYPIEGLDITGLNRSSLIKNLTLPFKLLRSFYQVRNIFRAFRPDAALGVGGYSSFPVLRLAQQKGIKTFIHESNSFAGKSNILLGKRADRIFVASKGMEKFFAAEKICYTGNPVRASIVQNGVSREEAIRFFELDPGRKTILVIGGSLGAKSINEAIDAQIEKWPSNDVQLIWQTGKPYAQRANEVASNRKNIRTYDFISRMDFAYAAADLVISRAGAMAIAELCVVRKPVIFVPYPFASEDHQTVNAMKMVEQNAAWMVKDDEAATQLINKVNALLKDEKKQEEFRTNLGRMAVVDADVRVAREVLRLMY